MLHKKWQWYALEMCRETLQSNEINALIDACYKRYPLTVRLFWKFISKNWKFIFEEQRTSNAVSISLWTTAHLTDKRPEKTIRKMGKFFNIRKYNSLTSPLCEFS